MWRAEETADSRRKPKKRQRKKNDVKNSTAEKQLFGIYHDCFHFGLGTLLAMAVSQALSIGAVQPIVERNAAECATGFRPRHSWCYSH